MLCLQTCCSRFSTLETPCVSIFHTFFWCRRMVVQLSTIHSTMVAYCSNRAPLVSSTTPIEPTNPSPAARSIGGAVLPVSFPSDSLLFCREACCDSCCFWSLLRCFSSTRSSVGVSIPRRIVSYETDRPMVDIFWNRR
uniref:(northern house mosquito) hypothetical protein n=1 Tax=Culex pipiens TaxID=7175 RepID=A0A8D8FBE8_CULPI